MRKIILCILLLPAAMGCAQLLGSLRRDLDDSEPYPPGPVIGGSWTEKGFLSEDMPENGRSPDSYASIGHAERSPAGLGAEGPVGERSWISPEQQEANQRDLYRGADNNPDAAPPVAFSSNPNVEPPVKRFYKNGSRATRSDFLDETPNEGSLWASDGQTNYYFTKNKVRGIGDLLTVNIEADLVRDIGMEFKRSLTPQERQAELNLAQERIRGRVLGLPSPDGKPGDKKDSVATSSSAPDRNPASSTNATQANSKTDKKEEDEIEIPKAGFNDIDVSTAIEIKTGNTMMAEIIERYPNGNYKIRATKKIPYKNGGARLLTLVGVAKGADIGEDDTLASGKLYEYRLQALR